MAMGHVRRGTVLATALLALAAAMVWQVASSRSASPLPVLYTLGGEFKLPSTLGVSRLADFRGQAVLLNFGFTRCPDVCPTALARMRDVMVEFQPQDVRALFITLDPDFDTVERLRPYVAHFDPHMVAMSGSVQQIDATARMYKVFAERQPIESELGYTIVHSAQIYLIDSNGLVRATFGDSVTVDAMRTTVRQLLRETS